MSKPSSTSSETEAGTTTSRAGTIPIMNRFVILLLTVVLAVVLNLLTCRWGTDVNSTSIMTFTQQADGTQPTGMFAAPFLAEAPWLALLLGILAPMVLLGIGFYVVVRGEQPKNAVK